MKIRCLWALLIAVCLLLGTASVVWAHVRVLPEEVTADSFEVFTVRVPTERGPDDRGQDRGPGGVHGLPGGAGARLGLRA